MAAKKRIDKVFLGIIIALTVVGFLIFSSASLGLLARTETELFTSVAAKQLLFGIVAGGIACFIALRMKYTWLRTYAFYIFITTFILSLCVFVPHLGMFYNGSRRWINAGPITFQPSELLKYGYIIYLAAWFAHKKKEIKEMRSGLIPFLVITGLVALSILLEPDTDALVVMVAGGFAIFVVAGARWRDIGIVLLIGILGFGLVVAIRPYVRERIMTFFNPSQKSLSSGYQIQQSLIAIGSGGITGRGFGQSIQKFNYLPEAIGDSIFAVAAEEFGFIGTFVLILLFVAFTLRGLRISARSPDSFASFLSLGIIMMISMQAFLNIGAMLSIIPLSGQTLPFVSHGGTALLVTLAAMGVILNVSRFQKAY